MDTSHDSRSTSSASSTRTQPDSNLALLLPSGSPTLATNPQSLLLGQCPVTVFLQEKCFLHRYIRSKDISDIVERPERLRAVAVGLATAISRLEAEEHVEADDDGPSYSPPGTNESEELTRAMSNMSIGLPSTSTQPVSPSLCRIVHSGSTLDLVSHPAVRYIHAGDAETLDPKLDYLIKLRNMAAASEEMIKSGQSEIPDGLPEGDLYLCPGSYDAIAAAAGTVCEAVDSVCSQSTILNTGMGIGIPHARSDKVSSSVSPQVLSSSRAFVAVRPPGHHCGEDTPSGFCFINNVAIGAAHAHLQHNVDRVVILDIDLHHGNGTQKIAWAINEDTHRKELEGQVGVKRGLKIFYGSMHDILSYPCEGGDADLIRDASVSIHNAHGQFIENVHLQPYSTEQEFHDTLYDGVYARLFSKSKRFLELTEATPEKTLFFISCGFDACENEYPSMSRHNRKVPVSFYERFAVDVCLLAGQFGNGKVISVLEGGYSDRALISGTMAHLSGLILPGRSKFSEWDWAERAEWWSSQNLIKLEKATKQGSKPPSVPQIRSINASSTSDATTEQWLSRALQVFSLVDRSPSPARRSGRPATTQPPPRLMTLRDRTVRPNQKSSSLETGVTIPAPAPKTQPKPRRSLAVKPPSNSSHVSGTSASTPIPAPRKSGTQSAQTTPNSKRKGDQRAEISDAAATADKSPIPASKARRKSAHGALPQPRSARDTISSSGGVSSLLPPIPALPLPPPEDASGVAQPSLNYEKKGDTHEVHDEEAPGTSSSSGAGIDGTSGLPSNQPAVTNVSQPQDSLKIKIKIPRPTPPTASGK